MLDRRANRDKTGWNYRLQTGTLRGMSEPGQQRRKEGSYKAQPTEHGGRTQESPRSKTCNLFTACSQVSKIKGCTFHSWLSATNGPYAMPLEINNSRRKYMKDEITNHFTEIDFQWNFGEDA